VGEDMFEKQGGNTGGVNRLGTWDENHPLCKPMVDHNQNRVKTRREQQIHDHVTQNLLKQVEGGGRDGAEPRDSRVYVNLVGLTSSTASHKLLDKGGQTGPPVVALNQMNSAEVSTMSFHQGAMYKAYQILLS